MQNINYDIYLISITIGTTKDIPYLVVNPVLLISKIHFSIAYNTAASPHHPSVLCYRPFRVLFIFRRSIYSSSSPFYLPLSLSPSLRCWTCMAVFVCDRVCKCVCCFLYICFCVAHLIFLGNNSFWIHMNDKNPNKTDLYIDRGVGQCLSMDMRCDSIRFWSV